MKILLAFNIAVISALLAFGSASCGKSHVQAAGETADNSSPTPRQIMSIDDKNFLIKAEKTETRQKTFATVALDNTTNLAVREFAGQVIEDRSRDLEQLRQLMNERDIPQAATAAEGASIEASQRLHDLPEDVLDREFVSLMTADQQQAIRDLRRAAESSPDAGIRSYAAAALSSMQKDFEAAAKLERTLRRS